MDAPIMLCTGNNPQKLGPFGQVEKVSRHIRPDVTIQRTMNHEPWLPKPGKSGFQMLEMATTAPFLLGKSDGVVSYNLEKP
jgi:hypothetical protein